MAAPMDFWSDIYTVIDTVAERDSFEEFEEFVHLKMLEPDYPPSVTDASMTSAASASDSQSEHTRPTTAEISEVTSNAPSYDLELDDLMQGNAADSQGDHASGTDQQPGLGRTPLLIPVLMDTHKERTVTDRPTSLPPTGGLMGPVGPVHRSSRAIAPKPGTGPQPAAITSWAHGSPHRPPEVSQERSPRPRTVFDPKKTAGVRAARSCLHCSIHKLSCDVEGPCATCGAWDPDNHERICVRPGKPDAILRSARRSILDGGRWTPELSPRLAHFNEPARLGEPVFITVYFSPRDWQGLEISVAKHADGNFRVLGGCSAFETEILKWAESDLRTAPGGDFQRSVETFLYLYSQRNCVEKKSLVDSVVRMSSLWRLISAGELCWTRRPDTQQQYEKKLLPPTIVAELKTFAQRKMASAEEKAIDEISELIPHAFCKNNTDTPAVWASLWSVILTYRQALQAVGSGAVAVKDGFAEVTRRLLDAAIVTLSNHFRTRRILEAVDSTYQSSFVGHGDVIAAFEQARLERRILYQELQTARCYGDDLIEKHVVQVEQRVTGRKRPKGNKQPVVELIC